MKRARALAWLLVVALLAMACPALADDLNVELADGANLELPENNAPGDGGLDIDPGVDVGGIDIVLPDLDLSGDLTDALPGAAKGNGEADGARTGTYRPQSSWDNDALFAGYVDMLFGKQDKLGLQGNGWAGDRLTGAVADAYDYLLKQVEKVAAGTLSDTAFYFPRSVVPDEAVQEVFYGFDSIIDALLADCPYHLFWYDKVNDTQYGYNDSDGFYVFMPVAEEYALDGDEPGTYYLYQADTALIRTAHVAVKKAKSVVKKYAGVSDYEKLCGYRDFICSANTYNDDAAADPNWPYGNPWQLIWVFDSDSTTNVVCEGYSKAFQYLCDLSSFSTAVQCHTIMGTAYMASGYGAHMWNIVTMGDGKNYHVDVTFVDDGFTQAFLCGAAPTQYDYAYRVADEVTYEPDDQARRTYPASVLKVSTRDFDPGSEKAVKSVKLKKGSKTLKKGQSLSLKRGKSLTLKAVLSPSGATSNLTWKSNKKTVTVRNGKVTVSKSAKVGTKAKITVTTGNGKSTYVYIVVK